MRKNIQQLETIIKHIQRIEQIPKHNKQMIQDSVFKVQNIHQLKFQKLSLEEKIAQSEMMIQRKERDG